MNLIIDPMCSENICSGSKNVTERNFSNKTNDNYLLIYSIILLSLVLEYLFMIGIDYCNQKKRVYFKIKMFICYFSIIKIVILVSSLSYYYLTRQINICNFNEYCYIENNTLLSDKLHYKLINDECPNYSEMMYRYTDYYIGDKTLSSMNSHYGYCQQNIQCEISITGNYSINLYSKLIEYERGIIDLNILKKDEDGSNCPDIVDIILGITKIHNNTLFKYLYMYLITDLSIMILVISMICMFSKDEHRMVKFSESV